MSQGAQYRFSSQQHDHNATNDKFIRVQNNHLNAPSSELQEQPTSRQENQLDPFLTGPDDYVIQNSINAYLQEHIPPPLKGNESSQARYCQNLLQWNVAAPSVAINHSPQSPMGASAAGHACHPTNQDLPGINPQVLLSPPVSAEFSHPGNGVAVPTTLSIATAEILPHSPVGPSTGAPSPGAAEDDIKLVVGSLRIQQAAESRRTKSGIHHCPYLNQGCARTFTAAHNLEYHIYSHLRLRPFKCDKCLYGAASPATLNRHKKKRHWQPNGRDADLIIEETNEPKSS